MSKKKGLGRDVNKSLEVMEDLLKGLSEFHKIPVKKGLNGYLEEDEKKDFNDKVNKAKEMAFSLHMKVEDLKDEVKGLKPKSKGNSRFASQRVVSKFLAIS